MIEGGQRSYGLVCLPEGDHWSAPLADAYVSGLSQEHGILHLSEKDLASIQIGDLVCILPAHSCLTVTLMKRYKTLHGQEITTLNEE
jgi:D-serine deaminase-like pyridoxal phosphate-dependent protein